MAIPLAEHYNLIHRILSMQDNIEGEIPSGAGTHDAISLAQGMVWLGVLVVLAAITRVYGIWEWSITGDEIHTVTHAAERAWEFVGSAYYLLFLASTSLFGSSEWAARAPNVVIGVVTIPVFYVMVQRFFDRQAALIACFFLVLNGWHLYHTQIARFYGGVALSAVIAYYCFYVALQRESYGYLAGALVASLLGVMFNATAVMVPASLSVFALVVFVWRGDLFAAFNRRLAGVYVGLSLLGVLAAMPVFLRLLEAWGIAMGGLSLGTFTVFFGVADRITVAIGLLTICALFWVWREAPAKAIYFLVIIAVPLVALAIAAAILPPVRPRYVIYILPPVLAIVAYLCVAVSRAVDTGVVARHALTAVVTAALLPGLLSYYTSRLTLDLSDPVDYIQSARGEEDRVIVFGPSMGALFDEDAQAYVTVIGTTAFWREDLEFSADFRANDMWIAVDTYRTTYMPQPLETWLMNNAHLTWRKHETRIDYSMQGFEVWQVPAIAAE